MDADDPPSGLRQQNISYKILLLQDHPLMVLGTQSFLDLQPGLKVCGSAPNPDAALTLQTEYSPDVILIELAIQGPFDFPFLRKLRKQTPQTPILSFSYHEEVIFAPRALDAGTNGYLMKEAPPDELVEAIRQVIDGKTYLSERVRRRIKKEQSQDAQLNGQLIKSFSNLELQVFQALGGEESDHNTLAIRTGLKPQTIGGAQYRMIKKLGLATQKQLANCARHWAYYEGDFA